jgi:hypothetical protein
MKNIGEAFRRAIEVTVDGREFSDLRCDFNITKSLKTEPNNLDLVVYNLSEDSRGYLQELALKKKAIPVQIAVGYKDTKVLDQIWLGDLRRCISVNNPPEWITTLSSGDGEKSTQSAKIQQSFGYNTPIDTVLNAIIRAVNSSLGANRLSNTEAQTIVRNAKMNAGGRMLSSGITISGNAVKELEKFCESCGIEVSIQDNKLQLLERRKALSETSILVSPKTGMIGTPEVDHKGVIQIQHLIQPGFKPGRLMSVVSKRVQGLYRIESLEYIGSTWDLQSWIVNIQGSRFG